MEGKEPLPRSATRAAERWWMLTTNAYGRRISAQYALIEEGKTAVIEAAGCIGLAMHPRENAIRSWRAASAWGR